MYTIFFITLLSICGSTYAMDELGSAPTKPCDLQPGQTVTWHTRKYRVINRIEQNANVKVIMERDSYTLCGIPVMHEFIIRRFKNGDLESTIGRNKPSLACISTCLGSACLLSLLLFYANSI